MERAGRLLGNSRLKIVELAGVRAYHLAPRAWAAAVGKKSAEHTRPVFLDGDKLIVEVADAVWQSQLSTLRGQILDRLETVLGQRLIRHIEFRVAPPRRQPGRVETAALHTAEDEADRIEDPVLRRLYRASRRKSTA